MIRKQLLRCANSQGQAELTLMNAIGSFSHYSNKVWIDIFVEHRTIGENASLRVHLLDGILRGNIGDFLSIVSAAKFQCPNWNRCWFLERDKID